MQMQNRLSQIMLGQKSSLQQKHTSQTNGYLANLKSGLHNDILDKCVANQRENYIINNGNKLQDKGIFNKNRMVNPEKSNINEPYGYIEHDPINCLCNQCDCGEHKCQIKVNRPRLSIGSVYKQDFKTYRKIGNSLKIQPQTMKRNSSTLQYSSIYNKDYSPPKDTKKQPIFQPKSSLNFSSSQLIQNSVYKQSYPGFYGNKLPMIEGGGSSFAYGLPFVANSNYRKDFNDKGKTNQYFTIRRQNSLKSSSPFVGQSTYNKSYLAQNQTSLNQHILSKSPEVIKNSYPSQIGTTYQGSFITPVNTKKVCPAKVTLDSQKTKEL